MKSSANYNLSLSQIRVRNTPNTATLEDGSQIHRVKEGKVWIKELGRPIKLIDYDNHFVALDPSKKKGRWFALCSCGSPAVIVGHNAYADGASPGNADDGMIPGEMIICYIHGATGKHADGSS